MRQILIVILFTFFGVHASMVVADDTRHGQFSANDHAQVWNEHEQAWQTPELFWQYYANNNGGTSWPSSAVYPQYRDVQEHDTFLVKVGDGVCLMEFFHQRWRRANDVRRWDQKFSQYSACDKVFD